MNIDTIYPNGNRSINEDSYVIRNDNQIFAVFDGATGIGGLSGDIASGILCEALEVENGDIFARILKGNENLGKKTVEALGEPAIGNTFGILSYSSLW
jgi:serine/threonine protein phosphatase PrpC